MHKLAAGATLPRDETPVFQVNSLAFSYPCQPPVLRGVSLHINRGDRLAIVGANGSGKSTLVKHLNGLLYSPEKPLTYRGEPLRGRQLARARMEVGLLFQDPDDHLFCNTIFEDVAFGPMNQGLAKDEVATLVKETLAAVGLFELHNKPAHHLSYGQRKRAALAAILAMRPETLVLDEPTANLDLKQIKLITAILKEFAGTLVCVSHDLFFLEEICTRAIVLDHGTIHHDYRITDLMAAPASLREHGLDVSFRVPFVEERAAAGEAAKNRGRGDHQSGPPTPAIVTLEEYSFRYGDGTLGLDRINLTINQGEEVALLGENGAGKSTLAACLTGILAGSGTYSFQGRTVHPARCRDLCREVGIIFQDSADQLFCPNCWEEVAFALKQQRLAKDEIERRVRDALAAVKLTGYEKRAPMDLSGGERKRLAIASVICMGPKLLIMDEPTAGLDLHGEEMFLAAISHLTMTKILISHDLSFVTRYCRRALILDNGRLIHDYPMEEFAAICRSLPYG